MTSFALSSTNSFSASLCTASQKNDISALRSLLLTAEQNSDNDPTGTFSINAPLPGNANLINALHLAASLDNIECLTELLAQRTIEVNQATKTGHTALILAATAGHVECVKALLQHPSIDVNATHTKGDSALIEASLRGNLPIVQALLNHPKINVNYVAPRGEYTALISALSQNHTKIVHALLAHPDIDINRGASDSTGTSPLLVAILASSDENQECLDALLSSPKIDVNALCYKVYTPLMVAAEHGRQSALRSILKHPLCDVNYSVPGSGYTALIGCIERQQTASALILLQDKRIDVYHRDNKGDTVLTIAAAAASASTVPSSQTLEMISAILEQANCQENKTAVITGPSPNATPQSNHLVNFQNNQGHTALYQAVAKQRLAVCELLLANPQLDPNIPAYDGTTPLFLAAKLGNESILNALLAHTKLALDCPSRYTVNKQSVTTIAPPPSILFLLCQHQLITPLQTILARSDNSSLFAAPLADGTTPLHLAARQGFVSGVQALCKHPAVDVNARTRDNTTPLLCAAACGHEACVAALLENAQIDPTIVPAQNDDDDDDDGEDHNDADSAEYNVATIAEQHGFTNCAQLIRNWMQLRK